MAILPCPCGGKDPGNAAALPSSPVPRVGSRKNSPGRLPNRPGCAIMKARVRRAPDTRDTGKNRNGREAMFSYIWPLGLVVVSNVVYQICAKSVPEKMDPFASLTITYGIGTVVSLIMFLIMSRGGNLFHEYRQTNWAPFVLGLVIVGLEVGYIYAYKAGWPVSVAQIVQASLLAVILIFVGYMLYKEQITWNKIVGILICLAGLGLINMK